MRTEDVRIGFIGFGNMGSAICDGMLAAGVIPPGNVNACAHDWEKLLDNTEKRGINACMTAGETAENSDLIVVAVKPYMVRTVLEPIKDKLIGKAVVSIAAGCGFDFYEEFLIEGTNHISTVPNTPVAIGQGIIVTEEKHSLTDEQLAVFEELFGAIGVVEYVDAAHVSVAGTLSGCGPAFAAMFIEALGDAGVKYGLKRPVAYRLAAQMIAGTGSLYMETGTHPGAMKDAVCSPGGTTIRGVSALEENGFRSALIKAIDAIEGK